VTVTVFAAERYDGLDWMWVGTQTLNVDWIGSVSLWIGLDWA